MIGSSTKTNRMPIFFDDTLPLATNMQRLADYDSFYDGFPPEATQTKQQVKSLYHECFMELVYEFAEEMLAVGRRDVYDEVMIEFMARARDFMNTEDAATEFASIRRLYNKTQFSLTDSVKSTREASDVLLAYKSEYHKIPQTGFF